MNEKNAKYAAALRNTWENIGHDMLAMSDGEPLDRDDVIESVLNVFDVYYPELAKTFRTEPTEVRVAVFRNAFPTTHYC